MPAGPAGSTAFILHKSFANSMHSLTSKSSSRSIFLHVGGMAALKASRTPSPTYGSNHRGNACPSRNGEGTATECSCPKTTAMATGHGSKTHNNDPCATWLAIYSGCRPFACSKSWSPMSVRVWKCREAPPRCVSKTPRPLKIELPSNGSATEFSTLKNHNASLSTPAETQYRH